MKTARVWARLYRYCLLLYPPEYRDEYAPGMERLFCERMSDTLRRRRTLALATFLLREFSSVAWTSLSARATARLGKRRGQSAQRVGAPPGGRHGRGILDVATQDLRYAIRMLTREPGFTVAAVFTLALGVGACTTVFSVVNAVLLRPLPYESPEELVLVWETGEDYSHGPVAAPTFLDWRGQNRVFERIVAASPEYAVLTGGAEPERINSVFATAGLFELFGVRPALGRGFLPEEEAPGRNRVVVLSHGLWVRRFGGSRGLVGDAILVNGEAHTVVGVMPPEFRFHSPWTHGVQTDLYLPATLTELGDGRESRDTHWLLTFARLRDAVTLESAQADMDAVARGIEERYPETNSGNGANVVPLHDQLVGGVSGLLMLLLGAAGFVLLIVCANVASLLLARVTKRQTEVGLRCALGASRGRLIRQFLTENVPVFVLGGTFGLLLAGWGVELLRSIIPSSIPRVQGIGIDARVLAFTAGVSVVTGFAFGIIPAVSSSRAVLTESLCESRGSVSVGSGRDRLRGVLIVAQFALSFVLLNGAALMLGSYLRIKNTDQGFDAENVLTMRLALLGPRYEQPERAHVFYDDVVERVTALPGVRAAATTSKLPLEGGTNGGLTIEGRSAGVDQGQHPWSEVSTVSLDYFRTMGMELKAGRVPYESELSQGQRGAVINETMARRFWSGEDPVGKRFAFDPPDWITVVGVAADVRQWGLERLPNPEVYLFSTASPWTSFMEWPQRNRVLVVRTELDPLRLVPAVKGVVNAVDADLPVTDIRTMLQVVAESIARRRFNTILIGFFSLTALVLVAAGVYGVMSYFVAQRFHEVGVRMALGADRGAVLRLVLKRGSLLAAIGVAVGLIGVFATTRVTASMVYGLSSTDARTIAGGALFLVFVALLGSWIPALKATRVDPLTALRSE